MTSHQQRSLSLLYEKGVAFRHGYSGLTQSRWQRGNWPHELGDHEALLTAFVGGLIDIEDNAQATARELVDFCYSGAENILTGQRIHELNLASHSNLPGVNYHHGENLHRYYGGMPLRREDREQLGVVYSTLPCCVISEKQGQRYLHAVVLQ